MLARIRGVKKATAKGRVYYYHRKTGKRIESPPGTAAFMVEVARLDGIATAAPAARAGTFGGLVAAYRDGPEWAALAPRTRADYDRVFLYLEPIAEMPLRRIDGQFVVATRDRAFKRHKRRFANYVLAVLSLLFAWGGPPRGWMTGNPAAGIPPLPRPRDLPAPNRPWKAAELAAVLEAAPAGLRAAVALGAYAGLREGDALRFPWSGYSAGEIEGRHQKTGEPLWMPAHRDLRAILDATPRRATVIVTGQRGLPLTLDGFRTMLFRLLRELEAAGRVGPGLTFHGLRHTIATRIAEAAGMADRDIMAVTGHRSTRSVKVYTDRADRRRRAAAAIEALERIGDENGKPPDRVGKPGRRRNPK